MKRDYWFIILSAAFMPDRLSPIYLSMVTMICCAGMLMLKLPSYQRPNWRVVGHQVLGSSLAFVRMAGTVIFAASMLIWFLSYYPRPAVIHEAHEAQRRAVVLLARPLEQEDQAEDGRVPRQLPVVQRVAATRNGRREKTSPHTADAARGTARRTRTRCIQTSRSAP